MIFSEPIAGGAPTILTTYAGTLNQGDDDPAGMFGFIDSADALVVSGSTIAHLGSFHDDRSRVTLNLKGIVR